MDYQNRIEKVRQVLKKCPCDAILIENPIDLLYLTGLKVSLGKIVITPQSATLLVDNRYFEHCKKTSPIEVLPTEMISFVDLLKDLNRIAFDSETTTYQKFTDLEKKLKDRNLVPIESPIQKIRSIKDKEEILILNEAASLGHEGFQYVKDSLKDGISEIELAIELEIFWKRKGGQGLAFEPIIAFGANSAMPHYRASNVRLEPDMPVLIDIGVKWNGYHSDMTRTFFWGRPTAIMQEIYDVVQEAQSRALALCQPGTLIGDLDSAARDYIASKGYGENFLHSLGHGVGLEIHEWPLIRKKEPYQNLPLEEGMVITIEPGIYLPGVGGVRIEDTIAITATGHQILGSVKPTHH